MRRNHRFLTFLRRPVILISGLLLTFFLLAHTPDYFEISKNLDIFNSVYRELNVAYVDGTRPGHLMKIGIDAMLSSLDPYTVYYTENDIEDFRYLTTGEYGGIGATVNDVGGRITVTDPYEGFSAWKAGLRAGDQIVGVNGVNVIGKKTDDIGTLLKGQAGTPVQLEVLKAGQEKPVTVTLNREEIRTKAVPYHALLPDGKTGYILLTAFTERCSAEVRDALMDLKARGCTQLVLDLRGNLGGLLMEAVNIVNFFIEKDQEVVFTKGRSPEWDKSYLTINHPIDPKIPIVVLVDQNSASASEIVSGALQDLDRAVIVGQRTYGKGLVQQTKDLVYNAKIKVTVAKYYIPSGRCVQALDYSHKDEEGRVDRVPDSLITAFKTRGGRIVYDGAGIMPDVKMPDEKMSQVLASLLTGYQIFNYATNFTLAHDTIAPATEFSLTDKEYDDFAAWLGRQKFTYETRSEARLEDLRQDATEEQYFEAIGEAFRALEDAIKQRKSDDLNRHRDEISSYLEEEIVSRYYFLTGRIQYSLRNDPVLKQAVSVLSDSEKMRQILTKSDPPQRPFNPNKKF